MKGTKGALSSVRRSLAIMIHLARAVWTATDNVLRMLLNYKPGLWGSVAVAWERRNWRPSRCSAPDVSIANTSNRTASLLKSKVRLYISCFSRARRMAAAPTEYSGRPCCRLCAASVTSMRVTAPELGKDIEIGAISTRWLGGLAQYLHEGHNPPCGAPLGQYSSRNERIVV